MDSDKWIIDSCSSETLEDRVQRLESSLRRTVLENEALRRALTNFHSKKSIAIPFDAEAAIKLSQDLSRDLLQPTLVERLLQISVDYAGAERGFLVSITRHKATIKAEAVVRPSGVEVTARDAAIGPSGELPIAILQHVVRTNEHVTVDDASNDDMFSGDETVLSRRMRSALALPIISQSRLIAILFLENNLAPGVFTPDRVAVLKHLASQAAISFENANLCAEMQKWAALVDVLPISLWTLETNGALELLSRASRQTVGLPFGDETSNQEAWMDAVHPEDREVATQALRRGVELRQHFSFKTRSRRTRESSYRRHLHQVFAIQDSEGQLVKFAGMTTDIEHFKGAEEALRTTQSALSHSTQVFTLRVMASLVAHELSQPLSGIWTNADAGARMLAFNSPDLEGVAESIKRTMRDAARASEIIQRLRETFAEAPPYSEPVNINSAITEVVTLIAGELERGGASVQTGLSDNLPRVAGNKIQLQQVIQNLMLNAIDAMRSVDDRPRIVRVDTVSDDLTGNVLVRIHDVGTGIDETTQKKLFRPLFTTKATSLGVGLSICRAIIENHGGRISVSANQSEPGACFSFSLPGLHEASKEQPYR